MSAVRRYDIAIGASRGLREVFSAVCVSFVIAGIVPLVMTMARVPIFEAVCAAGAYAAMLGVMLYFTRWRKTPLTPEQDYYRWKVMAALGLGVLTVTGPMAVGFAGLIWRAASDELEMAILSERILWFLFSLVVSIKAGAWLIEEERFANARVAK